MKNVTYALYHPSQFVMEVNFELERIVSEATANTRGTFLHEYTHFVQDFSYHGIWKFNILHQILREVFNRYQQKPNMELPVDFRDYTEKSKVNKCLYKILIGSCDMTINKGDIGNLSIELVDCKDYEGLIKDGFDLGKVQHVLIRNNRNGEEYSFGSTAICESMAHIIEDSVYPSFDNCKSYHLPYDACQLVVDIVYPAFSQHQINIAALCEIALSTQNPGELFYQSLVHMKSNNYIPANVDELYSYHNDNFSYEDMSVDKAFKMQNTLFMDNLKEFYNLFYSESLIKSYTQIQQFRNTDRLFWSKGLTKTPVDADQYYNRLMLDIKYPLIIDNEKGKLYIDGTNASNDNLLYIYAMYVLNGILFGQELTECKLYPICRCEKCNLATPWLNDPTACMVSNAWKLRLLPTVVTIK